MDFHGDEYVWKNIFSTFALQSEGLIQISRMAVQVRSKDYIGAILGGDEISCVGFTQNGGQAISSEHKETKKPSCLIFKWERCTASVFNIDLQYYKAKCLRLKHVIIL